MKNTIDELEQLFPTMCEDVLQGIKGGGGTPVNEQYLTPAQLQLIFNYGTLDPSGHNNVQAGFQSKEGQLISLIVENMYATPMGKALLDQLYTTDSNNINTGKPYAPINLINAMPTDGSSAEYFNNGSHNLYLGSITIAARDIIASPSLNQMAIGAAMSAFSHELFHGYEQIVKNNVQAPNGGEITGELQAYMFSEMVSLQFNAKMGTAFGGYTAPIDSAGDRVGEWNFYDMMNLEEHTWVAGQSQNQFLTLFNKMLNSTAGNPNNFNLTIYNQLIAAFAITPLGQQYNKMKTDPVTNSATQDIFALFTSSYQNVNMSTIPNGVIEWYNPTTGIFEDTPLGQNPNATTTSGYSAVIKSSDANVQAAITTAQNNGTLNMMLSSVRVEGQAAAAQAASLAKAAGLTSAQIQQAANVAVNATIQLNSGHVSGSAGALNGGVNVQVTTAAGSTGPQYITIYPDSNGGSSSGGNNDGHIDAATGMWFPDTTVVQGGSDGDINYIDTPVTPPGGGDWGGGGGYYA